MKQLIRSLALASVWAGLLLSPSLRAATLVWTNTSGGMWSAATNWSPNAAPAAGDTAIITNSGNYTVTVNTAATIADLTLGGTNATGARQLAVTGGTFTITNLSVASNDVILLNGGNLTTAGAANFYGSLNQATGTWQPLTAINVNNYSLTNGELRGANCVFTNFNWFGGALNADTFGNTITVPAAGTLNIGGATAKTMSDYGSVAGRRLVNNGTATWSGAGITGYYAPQINNNNTLTLNGDFTFAWGGFGGNPVFNNVGTLLKTNGTGNFSISSGFFNNNGNVGINTGSLSVNGQFNNAGGITISSGSLVVATTTAGSTNTGSITLAGNSYFDLNSGAFRLEGFIGSAVADHIRFQGATVTVLTTNLQAPTVLVNGSQIYQGTNFYPASYNLAAGSLYNLVPLNYATVSLTNAELRGANCVITNFNWLGGSLNAENPASNTVTIPAGGTLNISGPTGKTMSDYGASAGRRLVNNGTATWSGAGITGYYAPQLINNNSLTITSDLSYVWSGFGGGPFLINNASFNLANGADFTISTVNFTNNGTFNLTNGSLTMNGSSGGTTAVNLGAFNLDAGSYLYFNVGSFNLAGSLTSPSVDHVQFNGMTVQVNTTNLNTPSLVQYAGTVFQNTNVVVSSYNHAAGTLYAGLPLNFNTYNLTNAELRGANCVITNFNWLGGSLNAEGNSGSNSITIPAGGTLKISGATAKSMSDYAGVAGRRLVNNGTATWSGAGITGYYAPQLINNNAFTITSDLSYIWSGFGGGPFLINNGSFNLANGADFTISTVNFTNSGTFNLTNGSLTMNGSSGGTTAVNLGAFNLDAGSYLYCNVGSFNLSGSISSPAVDHVQFNGMTVNVNTTNLNTPSLVQFGGTVFQNTNVVVSSYNHAAGTLYAGVPLFFNLYNMTNAELRGANCVITNLNWLGGGFNAEGNSGSNSITIPAGGTLSISGATAKSLSDYVGTGGRRLINNGTATWSGAGIQGSYAPQIINNNAFTITSDLSYYWSGFGGGPLLINNASFNLANGADFTISTVNFTNNGTFNLTNGSLTMNGSSGGTTAVNLGAFNLDAGSYLYCNVGSFNLSGSISSPAVDHVQFNGMTVNVNTTNLVTPSLVQYAGTVFQNTNVVVSSYNHAAGTLYASVPLFFNLYNMTNAELRGANCVITNLNWLGGGFNAEGNNGSNSITIPAGGTLNISGATAKSLSDYAGVAGRRLTNNGTGTWSGATISGNYAPLFVNNSTLTMTGDSGYSWTGFGGQPIFLNNGTFLKSAGTGTATFSSILVTNAGSFVISNGGFSVTTYGFTQTAGSSSLGTNFSVSGNVFIGAGTFAGRGSIGGTFVNYGTASAGAPLGIISGTTSWSNAPTGVIRFEIGGTSPGTNFDQFRLTSTALVNGTADLALVNGFVPVPGNTFTCIVATVRSGVFTNLTFSSGYEFTALYTPTSVVFRAENALPVASLNVAGGTNQFCCTPFKFTASAFDTGGIITNLAILQNGMVLVASNSSPVSARAEFDFPQPYPLVVRAIDDQGGTTYLTQMVNIVSLPLTNVLYLGGLRSNDFKICLNGGVNTSYQALATTNLTVPTAGWQPLGIFDTDGLGNFRFVDHGAVTNQIRRFYRSLKQ